MTPRRCPGCDVTKPREAFYRSVGRAGGISYYCRDCAKTDAKRRAAQHKAANRCPCGLPRMQGYITCLRCLMRDRRRKSIAAWRPGGRGRPPGK
jgi:hypothetical protein